MTTDTKKATENMATGVEVFLTLTTEIETDGSTPQTIEFTTIGLYYLKNQSHYYFYEETEVSGMAGGRTSIKVTEDQVTMRRQGSNTVDLIFMLGNFREAQYETPYGLFQMETRTTGLEIVLDESGKGSVEIQYNLEIKGLTKSLNRLKIRIT